MHGRAPLGLLEIVMLDSMRGVIFCNVTGELRGSLPHVTRWARWCGYPSGRSGIPDAIEPGRSLFEGGKPLYKRLERNDILETSHSPRQNFHFAHRLFIAIEADYEFFYLDISGLGISLSADHNFSDPDISYPFPSSKVFWFDTITLRGVESGNPIIRAVRYCSNLL
jgi:hypothetical protein